MFRSVRATRRMAFLGAKSVQKCGIFRAKAGRGDTGGARDGGRTEKTVCSSKWWVQHIHPTLLSDKKGCPTGVSYGVSILFLAVSVGAGALMRDRKLAGFDAHASSHGP